MSRQRRESRESRESQQSQQAQWRHGSLNDSPIAALYEREALMVFAYILRRVPSREDAEDLLFEVFLAAIEDEGIADLPQENQRAWLLRVAHNKIVDHHRYSTRRLSLPLDDVTEPLYDTQDREPEQAYLQQEEYALLYGNLARLPALQQQIVHLRFSLELRHAEIASRLNRREGAIRVLLSRSLHFLRTLYQRQQGGDVTNE
jgi:RNA polymerase sigma-70 factor (ECF subfamily)